MPGGLAPSGIPVALPPRHDHKDTDDPDDEGLGDRPLPEPGHGRPHRSVPPLPPAARAGPGAPHATRALGAHAARRRDRGPPRSAVRARGLRAPLRRGRGIAQGRRGRRSRGRRAPRPGRPPAVDAVPRPTAPHAAARRGEPGVHPARRGGAAPAHRGACRRVARSRGAVRPHGCRRGPGRTPAARRDRRAPGDSRGAPARMRRLVGRGGAEPRRPADPRGPAARRRGADGAAHARGLRPRADRVAAHPPRIGPREHAGRGGRSATAS